MKTYVTIMNELGHSVEMEFGVVNGLLEADVKFDPPFDPETTSIENTEERLYGMLGTLLLSSMEGARIL